MIYSNDFNLHTISNSDIQKRYKYGKPGPSIVSSAIRWDGILFAYANQKGDITIRDIVRKTHVKSYKKHRDPPYALEFCYKNPVLASGDDDKVINLFDYVRGKVSTRLEKCHSDFVRVVRMMKSNPSTLLSGGFDKVVKFWDIRAD